MLSLATQRRLAQGHAILGIVMDDMDDSARRDPSPVPYRDALPEQAGQELTPSDSESGGAQGVRDLDIDAARLFSQAIEQTRMAICISDPHQDDEPIVYVNQAFVDMTGYPREEIIGRNCRFLQGSATSPKSVSRIRDALRGEEVRVIEILNYRKDGTAFWNALHVGPIYDAGGKLTHFYGSQWDITDLRSERERAEFGSRVNEELQHRTRNLFAVMAAIVRLSVEGMSDVRAYADATSRRIEAMGRAHDASIAGPENGAADLHGLVAAILQPYRTPGSGHIAMSGPTVVLPPELVTPIGLTLHELATNALKYGALCTAAGRLRIEWEMQGSEMVLDWTETSGRDAPLSATQTPGTGSRILRGVLGVAGGSIDTDWRPEGLHATVRLTLSP